MLLSPFLHNLTTLSMVAHEHMQAPSQVRSPKIALAATTSFLQLRAAKHAAHEGCHKRCLWTVQSDGCPKRHRHGKHTAYRRIE